MKKRIRPSPSKRAAEVKIDAVERAINALDAKHDLGPTAFEVAAHSAFLKAILKWQEQTGQTNRKIYQAVNVGEYFCQYGARIFD